MDDQTSQLDQRLAAVEKDTAVINATLAAQPYVTKEDFARLEGRVMVIQSNYVTKEEFARLEARVAAIQSNYVTKEEFSRLEARVAAIQENYVTKEDLAKLESHMIKWCLVSAVAICSVVIAAIKIWP